MFSISYFCSSQVRKKNQITIIVTEYIAIENFYSDRMTFVKYKCLDVYTLHITKLLLGQFL